MGIEKRGNSFRLSYQVNGHRYYKTIKETNLNPNISIEKQIKQMFEEFKIEVSKGMFTNLNYTFKEMSEIWFNEVIVPNCTPTTIRTYRRCLDNRILPFFGKVPVKEINTMLINRFVALLKNDKTKYSTRENKKLSKGTIQKNFNVVRSVMAYAYDNEVINFNPCSRVKLGLNKASLEDSEQAIHYWNIADYKKAMTLLEDENIHKKMAIEFALKTGLRRSEQWGLTWNDIDLNKKEITINKSRQKEKGTMVVMPCKNKSSIRTISIPDSLCKSLKRYKREIPNAIYIFQNLDYDSITTWFRKWQRKNNLTRIRWHDLRHTHATLLLYQGVNIKTISERLGHASIGTTMNTYTHVLKELDKTASKAIDMI